MKSGKKGRGIDIIATIGPASLRDDVLQSFKQREVSYIRVNLSHTRIEDLERTIVQMKKSGIEVVIDTEGSQIRTGNLGRSSIEFTEGVRVKVFQYPVECSKSRIYLRPSEALNFLQVGSLISIDFNSVLLKVTSISQLKKQCYIEAVVLIGGTVGNNKAVTIDTLSSLPPFSQKDVEAVAIAKRLGVKYFTLSFMDNGDEVRQFKSLYPGAIKISKIETKQGILHFDEILDESEGILIDRGDLSREIPPERIPIAQKIIIKKCNEEGKPVFVATNILESMSDGLKPMKSEINDVVNTILDGVNGLVLTKESAVGRYPVETVNMLQTIIKHTISAQLYNRRSAPGAVPNIAYVTEPKLAGQLVEPHGGLLVNRFRVEEFSDAQLSRMVKIPVDDEILMDAEQIAFGGFSPLEGFATSAELNSILGSMRLPGGVPWTMPVLLPASKSELGKAKKGEHAALVRKRDGLVYATVKIEDVYRLEKAQVAAKWFGTADRKHPGVDRLFAVEDMCVGGRINLLRRLPSEFKDYELTPTQTRKIFEEKGWSVIVGFHTRNAIHRSHEYIQLKAMEQVGADGLFVHPVIGRKQAGDFQSSIIVKAYEIMMKRFYPKNKVVFGVYSTFSRYAGPREAVFTALCRKNYGCSHFIVGRDHTGVGAFYEPWASHKIFDRFTDLGIVPVCFKSVYYSQKHKRYINESEGIRVPEKDRCDISGTQVRKLILTGKQPPEWFMRPDISKMILDERGKGRKVFV